MRIKRGIRDASVVFLADFYANAARWRRNSNRLRKMYGIGQDDETMTYADAAQAILEDLEKQLAQKPMPVAKRLCPECHHTMSLLYIGDIEIDYCTHCEGTWFDPGELKAFTGKEKDVPSDNLKSRTSRYRCPDCNTRMNEFVFQNPHNLLVDQCPFGHGVYLEKDELERALDVSYKE